MNCVVGDLAVIIKSRVGNEGKIVRIVGWIGAMNGWEGDDYWEVDTKVIAKYGPPVPLVRDSYMKPIRPSDGVDETLLYAGSPKQLEIVK